MLKVEITKGKCDIDLVGNLQTLCADISTLIRVVNDKLTKQDVELGHTFKILFTKGFMDGICFETDREHMEHYLAEGDAEFSGDEDKKEDNAKLDIDAFLDGFIQFLKDKRDSLERGRDALNKEVEDKNNEAE